MRKKNSYVDIVNHYQSCFIKHGDTHLGVDWPNLEELHRRYQVGLDVIQEVAEQVSLLDFGCGTAGLLEFMGALENRYSNVQYSGLDMGKLYINKCVEKFPEIDFYCIDILQDKDPILNFDYIIMNGVFTEKRDLSYEEMFLYFKKMITAVYEKCDKGISFNVMSKAVDWERDDLFHLGLDALQEFLTKEVSRDFVIRNDYGLYEYFVYIYK